MLSPKIGIIGAGNVGVRYAYTLMMSGLARSIVLLDVDKVRAEGEVLDLASGMPYLSPVDIRVGEYADLEGCDMVVITAGRKQKPGQSRMDLVKDNVELFRTIVPLVVKHAPQALLLVVTNPVDVLSYATYKISGKPSSQVFGSGTVLDSARLRFLLSRYCGIDSRNIHAYVLGEHGDSEFPVWSRSMIGTANLEEYGMTCQRCDHGQKLNAIFEDVRNFAYEIIARKGETSYGIGQALVRITEAVLKDENSILPVSSLVEGAYGVSGIYMSVPAVINRSGVRELLPVALNEKEAELFRTSARTIASVIKESGI